MDRDDKDVAASIADEALGVWEVSRNVLIMSQPDRARLAKQLDARALAIKALAEELRS